MIWIKRADGHEYGRYHGWALRLRQCATGWLISRRDFEGWDFVAGDTRRETAIAKAQAVLNG